MVKPRLLGTGSAPARKMPKSAFWKPMAPCAIRNCEICSVAWPANTPMRLPLKSSVTGSPPVRISRSRPSAKLSSRPIRLALLNSMFRSRTDSWKSFGSKP